MARRNIYQGPSSCYALNEGMYVGGRGVNFETGLAIAYLILRDYHRGWTYDHSCRRIPMDYDLAKRRLIYLIALATKHYGKEEADKLRRVIADILVTMRMPEKYMPIVRKWLRYVKKPVTVPAVATRARVRR